MPDETLTAAEYRLKYGAGAKKKRGPIKISTQQENAPPVAQKPQGRVARMLNEGEVEQAFMQIGITTKNGSYVERDSTSALIISEGIRFILKPE